jgi:hypothetical protein
MESSQNENVIIDGENEGLNECDIKNNFLNVNFQTQKYNRTN